MTPVCQIAIVAAGGTARKIVFGGRRPREGGDVPPRTEIPVPSPAGLGKRVRPGHAASVGYRVTPRTEQTISGGDFLFHLQRKNHKRLITLNSFPDRLSGAYRYSPIPLVGGISWNR